MTRVAVVILRKNGKILICQRKKNSRYGLKWEFPGGKVENGESIIDCLKRELTEELSISFESITKTEIQTSEYDDGGTFEVHYCYVDWFEGEPNNNVFEQIRWVTHEELKKLDNLEGNRTIVQNLSA